MVRIVSGTARGRKLITPEGLDTRPTLDRVKEAAFGSLQFAVPYSRVLDLFSGSGNLGLEAASRGAAHVVLNDRSPVCASIIRQNCETLGFSNRTRVLNLDYLAAIDLLSREGESFNIVFLDAPYRDGTAMDACKQLFTRDMIRPGGTVMLEYATELRPAIDESCMRLKRDRHYGTCSFMLLEGVNE
ncbi:MAG: 16S rRNA (guanine(966)-N(2))-methyltransferase RsmD [Clostridia bacterium]|nr:16S rRNA (guanine(966)-N(2))-methyltransferase RsmD [Clostridia bacterium]